MGQALWGIKSGNEVMPNWLKPEEKERCFATNAGWVLRHNNGIDEVLVAIANLKTKLGAASITEVKFATGTYTAGTTKTVRVTFNEKVTVTGTPSIVLNDGVGTIPASYTSTAGQGNVLVFSFTVPVAATTLSIGAQLITLAGGTIVETDVSPTVNADLTISTEIAAAAGTKVTV